jgi:glycerol-3-phosphate dehydrogenase (NAD(P)+)
MARTLDIDMPITRMIAALIDQQITLPQAIAALLARPLKQE